MKQNKLDILARSHHILKNATEKHMKHKKELIDRDYENVEKYAYLGMPQKDIAYLIGVSEDTYQRMLKTNDRLRESVAKGQAGSATHVLSSLFKQITRDEVEVERVTITLDADGKEVSREKKRIKRAKEPNARLLEFYLATKMGFRKNDTLEITGRNGDPIMMKYAKMSVEELEAELAKFDK